MGSPSLTGARPSNGRASVLARLGHGRPPWPSSPVGGLGGRPGGVRSFLCFCFSVDRLASAFEILWGTSMLPRSWTYQEDTLLVVKVWPLVVLDLATIWVFYEG